MNNSITIGWMQKKIPRLNEIKIFKSPVPLAEHQNPLCIIFVAHYHHNNTSFLINLSWCVCEFIISAKSYYPSSCVIYCENKWEIYCQMERLFSRPLWGQRKQPYICQQVIEKHNHFINLLAVSCYGHMI